MKISDPTFVTDPKYSLFPKIKREIELLNYTWRISILLLSYKMNQNTRNNKDIK
jgi:hypothetical protein